MVDGQVFFAGGDFLTMQSTTTQVKVYSADRLVRQAEGVVQPEESAPNGRECGPVVSRAIVVYEVGNTLRQRPLADR